MKVLAQFTSISLFIKSLLADTTTNIINDISQLELLFRREQGQFNGTDTNGSLLPGQAGRNSGPVNLWMQNLQEYGCWCFFDEKHGQGRGQPVDDFDSHCMKYHHAVSCAKLEIESCDPYVTTYQITTSQKNNGDIHHDCETGNDPCQEATCYAQSHFISLLLIEQLQDLQVPDYPNFSARTGNFDNDQCRSSGPGRERQEMCCGTWKHNTKKHLKFPSQLNRQCCDHPTNGSFKTYDASLASCCADGNVRIQCDD